MRTAQDILMDVEARVHQIVEDGLDVELSVNDWIGRIRGASQEAHSFARTGQLVLEEISWIEIAAIATRRIQVMSIVAESKDA